MEPELFISFVNTHHVCNREHLFFKLLKLGLTCTSKIIMIWVYRNWVGGSGGAGWWLCGSKYTKCKY